jgi:hypothetical protein
MAGGALGAAWWPRMIGRGGVARLGSRPGVGKLGGVRRFEGTGCAAGVWEAGRGWGGASTDDARAVGAPGRRAGPRGASTDHGPPAERTRGATHLGAPVGCATDSACTGAGASTLTGRPAGVSGRNRIPGFAGDKRTSREATLRSIATKLSSSPRPKISTASSRSRLPPMWPSRSASLSARCVALRSSRSCGPGRLPPDPSIRSTRLRASSRMATPSTPASLTVRPKGLAYGPRSILHGRRPALHPGIDWATVGHP